MTDARSPATHVKVLGPIEVVHGQQPIVLGGPTQRAFLGYLLLRTGKVVAISELVHALWRHDPPATARKIVQNSVSRLRQALSLAGDSSGLRIDTRVPGYVLTMSDAELDIARFEILARRGRAAQSAGSAEDAAALWDEALSLWRGRPLEDIADIASDWPESRRLENFRLNVVEDYFAARLTCGAHETILGELHAIADAEPHRERLLILLMLALYRSGRPAGALRAFERTRAEMISEFGLEPGPALKAIQEAVLDHNEALLWSATATGVVDVGQYPVSRLARTKSLTHNELCIVSTVLIKADACHGGAALDQADTWVRAAVGWFGGSVTARIGSLWMAVFGAPVSRSDDVARAVCAAFSIKHQVDDARIAIATGEVTVHHPPVTGDVLSVTGSPLEQCHALLERVAPGQILVTGDVRRQSGGEIVYEPVSPECWAATDFAAGHRHRQVTMIDGSAELDVITDVADSPQ